MPGVIEDLTDEEAYLLAILSDHSGIDQAEFLWYEPDEREGCWRAWPFQWAWFRNQSHHQIDQCFPTGTLVLTEHGHRPIEDIEVGDRVLTHLGRWRPVTHVFDRGQQPTAVIKGHGHFGLRTTPDHEFLMEHGFEPPKIGGRWASPSAVGAFDYEMPPLPDNYRNGRQNTPQIGSEVQLDTFLWLYGMYLAEGSISSSFGTGGKPNRVTFSVHDDEVKRITESLDVIGVSWSVWDSPKGAVSNVIVHSKPWAEWLLVNGGKGARNKHLQGWVLSHPRREMVHHGLLVGDGYYRNGRWSLSTISKRLCFDFKLLSQTLGHSASVMTHTAAWSTIDGRVIKPTGASYAVEVQLLCDQKKPHVRSEPLHVRSLVKSIEPGERIQCWDLEVEDDHSYVAESIVVHNCARSVGKTVSIVLRMFAFPLLFPGQDAVITAPELVHLEPLTTLIERRFDDCRLSRELLPHGRSSITHRPFQMNFINGCRIMGRIPQRDGRGVKGIHPLWLEMDEAQDYPEPGWTELVETLKRGHEGAVWRAHGVTRGMRDTFYEITQDTPDNRWKVHRFVAMHRPNWTDDERQEKIQQYGSRDHPDYRRNVLGLHGDATNPLFVLHRLMKVVDDDVTSAYNADYVNLRVNHEMLTDRGNDFDITDFIEFPERHKKHKNVWVGMDVGYTSHPSEILVFTDYRKTQNAPVSTLKLIARIHLERISNPQQCAAISHIMGFYKPRGFSMDKTGVGLPLFQDLQEFNPDVAAQIKGYGFSEKILVDFDEAAVADLKPGDDDVKEAGIYKNVLEYATEKLRELVDHQRLELPWDVPLLKEFQGQTWSYSKEAMDMYGRRRRVYSAGSFHALDAARMAVLGYFQEKIEEMIRLRNVVDNTPVFDSFVA